jgi:hypothetical protein
MFDPTAYENLKVVIEGAVYDKDLNGEIYVTDRQDLINLATLARRYEISFINHGATAQRVTATWMLEARLENLAAELLESALSEKRAGCHVSVKFTCIHSNDLSYYQKINAILKEIWGTNRQIDQRIQLNPFDMKKDITNEITICFNRLIYENQIQDLTSMIDFIIQSLRALENLLQ